MSYFCLVVVASDLLRFAVSRARPLFPFSGTQRQRRVVFEKAASHVEKAMSETRHCWYVSSAESCTYAGSSSPTWWPQPASHGKWRASASHDITHSSSRAWHRIPAP